MKTDVYLKVVFTVIAICLIVIAFKPMFVARAEKHKQVIDVNIAEINGNKLVPEGRRGLNPALRVRIVK